MQKSGSPKLNHPKPESFVLTEVLSALADPVRLEIVSRLFKNKHESKDSAETGWSELDFKVCKATLSHHVKKLRTAGIINQRKDGTRCFISIRADFEKKFPGLLKAILKGTDYGT